MRKRYGPEPAPVTMAVLPLTSNVVLEAILCYLV